MGSVDRGEERTFKVDFSGEGAAKLREAVRDKLKEFMGDYTDDTLVEYVVVLLRNGRRKDEARSELNVFLGDDSDSFVSWLWDHLASHVDLYVQPQEAYSDEVLKIKPVIEDHAGKDESQHVEMDSGKVRPDSLLRGRHRREWKGSSKEATEMHPLRSSEVENMHVEETAHHKVNRARRSPSPEPSRHKKRSRHDERQHVKRREASQTTIDVPRRLLQFAVRDAVGTLKPSSSVKEPSLKRLRSVVSTSTEDSSLVDQPRRIQSIARVPNPMATVVKAVREAAEDVKKLKPSRSVFDRLGRDMDIPETAEEVPAEHASEYRDFAVEDGYEEFNSLQGQTQLDYLQRTDYSEHVGNMGMVGSEIGLASNLISENEDYDDTHITGLRVTDNSHTGTSGGIMGEDSLMQYNVAKNAENPLRITRKKHQNQSISATNSSHGTMNIHMNKNTWKPHYQVSGDIEQMDVQKSVHENEIDVGKSGILQTMKENNNPVRVGNGNTKIALNAQKDTLKAAPSAPGSYTAGRPLEDADSRTIFVSNVHFAATKDSLSRHFNKFGEVLKVVIVTDATTGQPKGSAYVEFMRKEAADNALSLDGTSFMSRILKVVKRSSANQDATPMMSWPRVARGSPYAAGRFARVPFPRGIPGAFRHHLHVKPGARSMQWKRETQTTAADSTAPVSGSNVVNPAARSMTYVRTDPKPDGNAGNT